MGVRHKKTRRQKIIADYRHKVVYSLENINTPSHEPIVNSGIINKNSNFYSYVLADVSKTGFLTIAIIAFEIILFFLLKNHILTLPIVKY